MVRSCPVIGHPLISAITWGVVFLIGCNIPLVVVPPVPVDPAPITESGNRCLIVYESGEIQRYPAEQVVIFTSTKLRQYLNQHCVKDKSGLSEYRIVDDDTEFTGGDDGVWPDAMKIERKALPWIVVSNGKSGFSGPLPSKVDEVIELCRKYFETK